jgi:hypothetical protein
VEEPPEIEAIEVPPLADDIPVVEPLPERVPARGRRHEEPPTVPVVGEAPPPRNLPREAMLRLLAKHFAGAPNVFIMPLIPEKKLRNVRDQYRPLLPPDNEPLLLYDGTLLGHARDGFCFFDSGLGWKGGMAGVGFLAYGSLDPRQVKGDERIFASGLVLSAKAKASVLYQDVAKIVPAVRAALAEIRSLLASQPGA